MVPRGTSPSACARKGRRISVSLPVDRRQTPHRRAVNGTFRQKEGQFLVPLRTWGPQRLSYGVPSVPVPGRGQVSRRCRAGPGPGPGADPRLQLGAPGPWTFSSDTASLPTSASSRPQDGGGHQPQLGGPRGGVGPDDEDAVGEGHRRGVRRHVRAHDLGPPAHAPSRPRRRPSSRGPAAAGPSGRRAARGRGRRGPELLNAPAWGRRRWTGRLPGRSPLAARRLPGPGQRRRRPRCRRRRGPPPPCPSGAPASAPELRDSTGSTRLVRPLVLTSTRDTDPSVTRTVAPVSDSGHVLPAPPR